MYDNLLSPDFSSWFTMRKNFSSLRLINAYGPLSLRISRSLKAPFYEHFGDANNVKLTLQYEKLSWAFAHIL